MQSPLTRIVATAALAAALGACSDNNGNEPPTDHFFFPTALALHRPSPDADADFLYVVNSDFDLAFNGSTVTAVDLSRVRARMADHAGCKADHDARGAWICDEIPLVRSGFTRKLNPYAVEAAMGVFRSGAQRLYVIVRGGNSLAWFDVRPDGSLDCGPIDDRGYCAGSHYAGNDPSQSPGGLVLPQESSSLSIDPDRGWIVMTHQSYDTSVAHASLLRDPIASTPAPTQSVGPTLVSTLGGTAAGLSALTLLPRASAADRSTWLAVSRAEASFTLLQAYGGNASLGDNRAFLYRAAAAPVTGLNTGADSRAIVLDPVAPSRVAYVVSRSPTALLTLDISNPAAPSVTDATALPAGPSRAVAVWQQSLSRTYVYAVSYDARWIYVVDPSEHRVVDQIATNRGPHNLVHDARAGLLYVVDFLDFSVEVVDVSPSRSADGTPNPMFNRRVLTFGRLGRAGGV